MPKERFVTLKKYSKYAIIAIVIMFSSAMISRGAALYSTGSTTLDPQCSPGDPNCTVSNTPMYTPQGAVVNTTGGLASGTNLGTTAVSIQSIIDKMLYPYVAPSISITTALGSGTNGIIYREKGVTISSLLLTATTTKRTNTISSVLFKRAGATINTVGSPQANGGSETYTDATGITNDTTYTATVSDGTSNVNSSTVTFSFIFPYYYGVGAPGLNGSQIAALTKSVQPSTATFPVTTSPSDQVFYFAYPSSYPALTRIDDPTGFQITADYTVSTVSITNSFGVSTNYRVYEYKNKTTQTGFTVTYKQ